MEASPQTEVTVSHSVFTTKLLTSWLRHFHGLIVLHEKLLTELDRAIGDADHGINMRKGTERVMAHLNELRGHDLAGQLRIISGHFTGSIGGASGPLYGAFFLHAACVVPPRNEIRIADFVACFDAGLNGVVGLGRAQAGEKTMVDVLIPVAAAYKSMTRRHLSPKEMFTEAALIAEAAMKSTIPMQASKGRASYLGERSIGHQDPGATSIYLLIDALSSAVAGEIPSSVNKHKETNRKLIP